MGASSLGMTLDDVIKTKGNKRGRVEKKVVTSMERKTATAAALAPAAKAAAAAARATATATLPAGTRAGGGVKALGGVPERLSIAAPKAVAAAPKAAAAEAMGTEAKLMMTLEDMIKSEVVSKRSDVKKAAEANSKLAPSDSSRTKKRGGRRRRMTLRSDGNFKAKAEPKAKAKAKAKVKASSRARTAMKGSNGAEDWFGKAGAGKGKGKAGGWDSSWSEDRTRQQKGGSNWNAAGGQKGGPDWGAAGAKRRAMSAPEMWATGEKRMRGWGGGAATDRGSSRDTWGSGPLAGHWSVGSGTDWGASSGSKGGAGGKGGGTWGRAWGSGKQDPSYNGVSGSNRSHPAGTMAGQSNGCQIKVTNVPINLDQRDIREAFEDNGRVVRCEVERGVAWITFESMSNARKAMHTFDRGELNGQTIFVTAA